MQQKLFQIFLPQEVGALGNNIEKEPHQPRSKMQKHVYYIFTENICLACILQTRFKHDSNFLTLKVALMSLWVSLNK